MKKILGLSLLLTLFLVIPASAEEQYTCYHNNCEAQDDYFYLGTSDTDYAGASYACTSSSPDPICNPHEWVYAEVTVETQGCQHGFSALRFETGDHGYIGAMIRVTPLIAMGVTVAYVQVLKDGWTGETVESDSWVDPAFADCLSVNIAN